MQKEIDNFYTIIIQVIDGGVYISQFVAKSEVDVMNKWVGSLLNKNTIEELTIDNLLALTKEIDNPDNRMVALSERVNVWFSLYTADEKSLLVNVIKTALPTLEQTKKGILALDSW